jgi:hypothetical protein
MRYGRDFRNRHPRDDDFGFLYYRAEQRFGPWDSGGGYDFQGGYGDRARADYPEGGGWAWPEFGRFDTMGGGGMGRDAGGTYDRGGCTARSATATGTWRARASAPPRTSAASGSRAGGARGGSGAVGPRAADIMTENPEAVTPDTSLVEVARRMRDLDVGIIPVVDDLEEYRLRGSSPTATSPSAPGRRART